VIEDEPAPSDPAVPTTTFHQAPPPPRPPAQRPNWLLWFLVFTGASMLVFTAMIFAMVRGMQPAAATLDRGTTLSIDLGRSFPEEPLYDMSSPFVDSSDVTFRDLLFSIRAAKEDHRVERLLLHVRGNGLGWANTFELRSSLIDFKSAGKPLIAFVEYASNRSYAIASAADEVYLHPRGTVDLRGVRAELTFVKGALDKLGVEAEFERFGEYKDGPDVYLRQDMSPESREALGAVVDTLHDALVTAVAEGRGMTVERAVQAMSEGPLTAEISQRLGLVDGLKYWDEVRDALTPADEEWRPMTIAGYRNARGSASAFSTQGRIAIIYGIGAIVSGSSGEDSVFGRVMGADTIAGAFRAVREDDDIDAVVFRIDSPGGSDIASDVIWREAMLTHAEKPVVISMGNVAASGGYWIAMASDTIVAEETTITGSIGIYGGKFNLSGLYEKIGLSRDGISSAPSADFFSDNRRFTAEERRRFRGMLEDGYRAFLQRVSEARGKTIDEVDALARGRVWAGREALEHGLVDELGGLQRALAIAKEKAGFDSDDPFEIAVYPEKRNVFEALLSGFLDARSAPRGLSQTVIDQALHPRKLLESSRMLESLLRGDTFAMMPFELELR